MRRYAVILHPEAEAEIAAAFAFIQTESPLNAARWLRGLYATIDGLETFPRRFGRARESEDLGVDLRQLVYKSHRLIFEVQGETVYVLHFRHTARPAMGKSAITRRPPSKPGGAGNA
jgi:plasmid stabilization system protein ParE